ncbi:MAG: Ubiquinone/menaquinone biosynthesis C-methyltransferase UbiE [Alphaproteobacteria bacterium MarineAlpha5_Bin11]|mgnify:CR=1 FL=1|nr:bifunctional demethylmenaquinone methyltransferase/2-methoxy-6-polyprenyl-1,4-benzoquinol methylase [Pelagibacteraceae bacterium]PPR45163.1 MAG: Ubiquinone/menaquinone biosynthesis C-methyltransferase UbiE [Alphaproteobacteria bacterium MarineAlpha5_Bin11]PPR52135.1 MAG: Ubiquinone/menaquinone biosynthesis C-methyltransferase UbiE [Alphaproteobacteria bacterium MarineAlpha5_Bin10]|tara:strand:+ start:21049 stop:21786 length:738 start_codon:yes stop_codon:yes gene_type:complete
MKNLSNQFGNKKVSKSQKTKMVQDVFHKVSENYDLMNDLMSLGAHRLWKKRLLDIINIRDNEIIIDVGAGTGDIGSGIIKNNTSCKVYLVDSNPSMIRKGKSKTLNLNSRAKWINASAEKLPFNKKFFDKYLISFCLRNVTNIEESLIESYRVLKDGGQFVCLEFSKPITPMFNNIYNIYKNNIIPILGHYISNQKSSYQYLAESIDNFPNQKYLTYKLKEVGYVNIKHYNLFNGIAAIHSGWKV